MRNRFSLLHYNLVKHQRENIHFTFLSQKETTHNIARRTKGEGKSLDISLDRDAIPLYLFHSPSVQCFLQESTSSWEGEKVVADSAELHLSAHSEEVKALYAKHSLLTTGNQSSEAKKISLVIRYTVFFSFFR